MKRYSAFAVAKEAIGYHQGWERAWGAPELKSEYDVVIIGAGGHGLATAYYLAKNHGVTNVAVIEKGWLGGGHRPEHDNHPVELPAGRFNRDLRKGPGAV